MIVIQVSVFHHLVWPHVLHKFVEAKDRWAWLQKRELHVDFVPNRVVAGTVGWHFLDKDVQQFEDTWDLYQIPARQVDAVLAQLMLLHHHVRCMVDPQF